MRKHISNIVVFLSLVWCSRGVCLFTQQESTDVLYLLNAARMMTHKSWAVRKIFQYCLWYNKDSHYSLHLEERVKCYLGIIAVCGPAELIGHQIGTIVQVLGRCGIYKNESYVKAILKVCQRRKGI